MSKFVKTLVAFSAVALVLGVALAPAPAAAQTAAELETIIASLQSQIEALTAQFGGSNTGSGGTTFNFTRNLTLGSTGEDVRQLQQFLNNNGFSVAASGPGSPGLESTYFGNLTKSALAAFQVANGISPAVGYFGPITRSAISLMIPVGSGTGSGTGTGTLPAGCTSTAGYSSTTGVKCDTGTGTLPAGCTSTAGYSSTTGVKCDSTGGTSAPVGLEGGAGFVTVTQTSTDVEDEVLTGEIENVLGFKVEASGSDVKVSNVRVKFTEAVDSSASDRFTSYADEIIIYADGEEVGSLDASDFVRDSAGVYSANIPVTQVVRMGSGNKVIFHVGFKAVDSIDSDDDGSTNDWTALFVNLRYEDATGVVLTDTTTSISNSGVYVERVSSSSNVKLRMAEGSNNPTASNVKVSTSGSTDVVLAEFTLKAEGSDMYFDQLRASTTITGTTNVSDIASDFYLMRGSSRLAEVAATTGTSQALTFSLDDIEEINSGDTQTYQIVAKVKSIASTNTTTTFGGGDTIQASTSAQVWNINAKADSDGKSVTERAGSITTYVQTLYNEGIAISKVGESFTLLPNDTAANVEGTFTVTVRVMNFGSNDVYIPLNSVATTSTSGGSTKGIAFGLTDGTTATSTGQAGTITGTVSKTGSGGVEKTNSVLISGGQSADFKLTTTFNPDVVYTGTRQYRVQIWSVGHAATDVAAATTIVDTTPVEDFRTSFNPIQN